MIGYVMVGTNNLEKAIIFYDEVLKITNVKMLNNTIGEQVIDFIQ